MSATGTTTAASRPSTAQTTATTATTIRPTTAERGAATPRRPGTSSSQQDAPGAFKAIRYEETADGPTPALDTVSALPEKRAGRPGSQLSHRFSALGGGSSSSSSSHAAKRQSTSSARSIPRISSPIPLTAEPTTPGKRDSGIAASVTSTSPSLTSSGGGGGGGGGAAGDGGEPPARSRSPLPLPSILVQDSEYYYSRPRPAPATPQQQKEQQQAHRLSQSQLHQQLQQQQQQQQPPPPPRNHRQPSPGPSSTRNTADPSAAAAVRSISPYRHGNGSGRRISTEQPGLPPPPPPSPPPPSAPAARYITPADQRPSIDARIGAFRALDTEIPATKSGDFGLADLASDRVGFSHRGSMIFRGKRMAEGLQEQREEEEQAEREEREFRREKREGENGNGSLAAAASVTSLSKTGAGAGAAGATPPPTTTTTTTTSSPPSVSSRRRQPPTEYQIQQVASRALSPEEVNFSLRVRSMYDHGNEEGANWAALNNGGNGGGMAKIPEGRVPSMVGDSNGTPATLSATAAAQESLANSAAPSPGASSLSVDRLPASRSHSRNNSIGSRADHRNSYYAREATELAGGIEDWGNIEGQEVDRYGFIVPSRSAAGSRLGTADGSHPPAHQRVATSLLAEANSPRRSDRRSLRRIPSNSARSARSVPPRPSRDWTSLRKPHETSGSGSVRSGRSTGTAASGLSAAVGRPFRSRHARLLAEASDMLTLPPGLADIAEQDDAGRTASLQKQREWKREQKWQRMARPVQSGHAAHRSAGLPSRGGGMRFDFDTTDPKLIERTWKGIPDRWRATAWHSFLAASAARRPHRSRASDAELIGQFHKLQAASCADDVQIDVDVPRTVGSHIMFRRRYRGGQRLLFRVLHALSLYFPHTGYVQGMASLAATLLCYYDEETAFVMLVRMWQLRGLERLFAPGFGGLMAALADFEAAWLARGDVAVRLEELGITSTAYGTRWYLTLFNMSVPFPAQLRVWDVFLLLGDAVDPPPPAGANGTGGGGPGSAATSVAASPVLGGSPAISASASTTGASTPVPPPAGGAPAAAPTDHPFAGADLDVLHATSAALVDATREILLDSDFENAMKVLTSFVPIRDEDLLMRVAKAEWKVGKRRGVAGS